MFDRSSALACCEPTKAWAQFIRFGSRRQPNEADFGTKDFHKLAVIRRMVEDLCIPVKITAGDVFREPDGLAMSSRNTHITPEERPRVNQL